MTDDNSRLAVLIDADNVSAKVAKDIFEELAGYGTLTVKRAYGDWTETQLNGWKGQLHKYAISPMQQFANTKGKNSSDSALIIDAMDLLYAGNLDGFVIVSSDSDFTRLATRLREAGKTVYGVGARKTPEPFRDACDKFTFIEVLVSDSPAPEASTPRRATRGAEEPEAAEDAGTSDAAEPEPSRDNKGALQSMLTKAVNKTATDDDWSSLGSLGSHLNRTDPSFDSRTYGFAKLSDLVKAQPFLEFKTVGGSNGPGQLWVRLKGRRGAAPAAEKKPAKRSSRAVASQPAPDDEAPAEKKPAKRTVRKVTKKSPEQAPGS